MSPDIAAALNAEHIPPPRKGKRGWIASTVREMLKNPHYIGEWSFKKKQWLKEPQAGKRRYRCRPDAEVMRDTRPDLAIIDAATWKAVQAKLAARYAATAGARKPGAKERAQAPTRGYYPFSGIRRCAQCGDVMVIAGGNPNCVYKCGNNHKRGI